MQRHSRQSQSQSEESEERQRQREWEGERVRAGAKVRSIKRRTHETAANEVNCKLFPSQQAEQKKLQRKRQVYIEICGADQEMANMNIING